MLTLPVGPLVLPLHLIVLFVAVLVAWGVGTGVARRRGSDARDAEPEHALFQLLLLGLAVARLAFVADHWEQYRGDGLQLINIRDGGFYPAAGVVAAVIAAVVKGWRRPVLRQPLGWGMAAGLSLWLLATTSLSIYQQGMQIPAVVLRNMRGDEVQLADLRGKPMVVNLWATWCPPCRREMPVLAAAQAEHTDITFLFVNQGEGPEEVHRFLTGTDLTLTNLLFDDGGQLSRHVGSRALPTTIFFDAAGNQAGHHLGELSRGSLAHYLSRLTEAGQ